jgi:predicted alpha/beta superfamily hydrolase
VEINERFRIRGVSELVNTTYFATRRVDFWAPNEPTEYLLVAHDGQNIFDKRTATKRRTWKLAQAANRIFRNAGLTPPIIIGIFHSSSKENINGRGKDLTPQSIFQSGVKPILENIPPQMRLELSNLNGDDYQKQIADEIIPTIAEAINHQINPNKTAMVGSSMGGLATLYGFGKYPDLYKTALAFSTHWILGGDPLVKSLITHLPKPVDHKLWLSCGGKGLDQSYIPHHKYAQELLAQNKWQPGKNLNVKDFKRARHNENEWANQVDQALQFWIS